MQTDMPTFKCDKCKQVHTGEPVIYTDLGDKLVVRCSKCSINLGFHTKLRGRLR
jgi:uncharacterized Zn-finger protein